MTEKFHEFLYSNSFTVLTDNNPLTYVLKTAKLDTTEVPQLDHLSATEATGDAEETSISDSDNGTCVNAEVDLFQEDLQLDFTG